MLNLNVHQVSSPAIEMPEYWVFFYPIEKDYDLCDKPIDLCDKSIMIRKLLIQISLISLLVEWSIGGLVELFTDHYSPFAGVITTT
jgi:hypothetical protein